MCVGTFLKAERVEVIQSGEKQAQRILQGGLLVFEENL